MVLCDDERSAFLLVLDERLVDFDSQGGNHISVYLVTHFELSDQSYKDVLSFNDDLLGMEHNCSYAMDILSVKEELDFDFPFNMLAIKSYVQELIIKMAEIIGIVIEKTAAAFLTFILKASLRSL